jgi:Flp pilus assembly pilin Flp
MLEYLMALIQERMRSEERGQTLIEYAIVLALIVTVILAAFTLTDIGGAVSTALGNVVTALGG